MNSTIIGILASGLAGLALGGAYFTALWWTVRLTACVRRPALLLTVSYLLRAALLAGGILLVGMRDWRHLTVCLVGLLGARVLACRLVVAPDYVEADTRQPVPCADEGGKSPCN